MARLIFNIFACQKSTTQGLIDSSKRSLRACKRLWELERKTASREAYEASCSITLTWPFKLATHENILTVCS